MIREKPSLLKMVRLQQSQCCKAVAWLTKLSKFLETHLGCSVHVEYLMDIVYTMLCLCYWKAKAVPAERQRHFSCITLTSIKVYVPLNQLEMDWPPGLLWASGYSPNYSCKKRSSPFEADCGTGLSLWEPALVLVRLMLATSILAYCEHPSPGVKRDGNEEVSRITFALFR